MSRPSPSLTSVASIAPDQVFLSPRVVDQATFAELAGALRELVEKAGAEARALANAADSAREAHHDLLQLAPGMDARVLAATSALGSLDVRLAEAAGVVAAASERAGLLAAARDETDAVVTRAFERAAALEARLLALVERAERAAALIERAEPSGATQPQETASASGAPVGGQIEGKPRSTPAGGCPSPATARGFDEELA